MIDIDCSPVVSSRSSHSGNPLLRMRDVASRFNLHPNTIRKATDCGLLPCYKTAGGNHRRFALEDVLTYLGQGEEGNATSHSDSAPIPVALVSRVSSSKQASNRGAAIESDLDRQCRRLKEYAAARWGSKARTTQYVSVGSGLNFQRPELLKLISDILAGKYANGFIVATYKDRVARFGVELIETICRYGNCQLVFTEAEPTKEVYENIATDVLEIITHFTARASGEKARKNLKVFIPPDVLTECFDLKKQGYTNKQIAAHLEKNGRGKDEKGRTISHQIIQKTLAENQELVNAMAVGETDVIDPHSFARFYRQFIKPASDSARLVKTDLMEAYRQWAEKENLPLLSGIAVGKWMKAKKIPTIFTRGGNLAYVALALEGLQ